MSIADTIRQQTAELGVLSGVAALVSQVPGLPPVIRGILVGAFVLCGPGAAVLAHLDLAPTTHAFGIPVLSLTTILLATFLATATIGLHPTLVLVVLSALTVLIAAPVAVPALRRRA